MGRGASTSVCGPPGALLRPDRAGSRASSKEDRLPAALLLSPRYTPTTSPTINTTVTFTFTSPLDTCTSSTTAKTTRTVFQTEAKEHHKLN